MLGERQIEGYVILRDPGDLLADYEHRKGASASQEYLTALRNSVSFLNPARYRGIAREPLSPWNSDQEQLNGNARLGEVCEVEARKVFEQILGEDRALWDYEPNKRDTCKEMFQELVQAREVYSNLKVPQDYEIVHLARGPSRVEWPVCGYDIGQWAGDHFSLICDSVIRPEWHPPAPDDIVEISRKVRNLNEHGLFSTIKEALQFREYYLSKEWAETETFANEFGVIRVGICP